VIGFPHMLARLIAARDDRSLRTISRLYPVALVLLWIPAVLLGVWGAAAFPGLEGRESDLIFSKMIGRFLPPALGSIGVVAVVAAVMSTLDAQLLTLSSMLVRDVLDPLDARGGDRRDIRLGRWFLLGVAALVFLLSRTWGESVYSIAAFAFSGYVTLTPTLLLGVRWSRFNAAGAVASLLAGNAVLAVLTSAGLEPLGFLPVFWALVAASVAAVAGSFLAPPSAAVAQSPR
jgi:SSS family solute:Na+ symporter